MNIELQVPLSVDDDASKQEILDCARALYIEYGLRRTTMEDVAKRAGIGRATLYRRFNDKEQLFQAVILRDVQRDLANIQASVARQRTFLDGLLEGYVMAVGLLHHNPLLSRLLTTEPDTVLPFLTTDFGAVMAFARNYIAPQIQRGQEAGHIKGLPADVIAEMILRTIHSMMLTRVGVINPGDEASIRSFAQQFLRPLLTP